MSYDEEFIAGFDLEKAALKIHGYICDNFSDSSFSGNSEFDAEYFKYKPPPIKIDKSRVVVIRKPTNTTDILNKENIETKLTGGNKNQQHNSNSHTGALKKKVRRKRGKREPKNISTTEYSRTFSNDRLVNTNSNSTIDGGCTSKINTSSICSGDLMESKADLYYNNSKIPSSNSGFVDIFGNYFSANLDEKYEITSSTKSPTFKSSKNGPMKGTESGEFLKPSVLRDSNLDKSTCTVAENSVNETRKSSFSGTHNSGSARAEIPPSSSKISFMEKIRDHQKVIADYNQQAQFSNFTDNQQTTFEVIPEKSNAVQENRSYPPVTNIVAQDIIDSSVVDDNINLLENDVVECCKCVIL